MVRVNVKAKTIKLERCGECGIVAPIVAETRSGRTLCRACERAFNLHGIPVRDREGV